MRFSTQFHCVCHVLCPRFSSTPSKENYSSLRTRHPDTYALIQNIIQIRSDHFGFHLGLKVGLSYL